MAYYMLTFCILLASSISSSAKLVVDRDVKDIKYGFVACQDSQSTGSYKKCTCKPDYNAVMSNDGEKYLCKAPWEIGCYYSLLATKQTFLITRGSVAQEIHTHLTSKVSTTIHRIYVWNLVGSSNYGKWYDVTKEASWFFRLKSRSTMEIGNLDMKLWQGMMIKFEFGWVKPNPISHRTCMTVKVKGRIVYPFDLDAFKSKLPGAQ